jgi:hypothetical protein
MRADICYVFGSFSRTFYEGYRLIPCLNTSDKA